MSQRVRGLLDRLLARRREAAGDGVPDAELLRRYARDRDEAAFELLVWRHGAMVLGLCRRAVRDEQLAEDAFQAVFLVLARKAGGVRGNLGGWLFRVARRVSVRAAARQRATRPLVETASAAEPDPVERRELADVLDAEVARLPARLRAVVVLCYLGGLSTEDAARELGCPRGTVLSRLSAARAKLAARLTRRGVTLPTVVVSTAVTRHTISSAVATARAFRTGPLAASAASQLASGVLHAMTRTTILTAAGAVAVAALLTGVGWTAASGDGPPPSAQPVADAQKPAPKEPPAPKEATRPDETARSQDPIERLERMAAELQREIEVREKQIELNARAGGATGTLALLQARHAEADAEVRKAERELMELEAEGAVLKRRIAAVAVTPPEKLLEGNLLAWGEVLDAARAVEAAQRAVAKAKAADPNAPTIKELQAQAETAQTALDDVRRKTAVNISNRQRDEQIRPYRERLDALELSIEIKREQLAGRSKERGALSVRIDANTRAEVSADDLRRANEPLREALARVQRQLLTARLAQKGVTLTEPAGPDAKLDAILRELAALRKDVQELRQKK